MNKIDWAAIPVHFADKKKKQCVEAILQLPLEARSVIPYSKLKHLDIPTRKAFCSAQARDMRIDLWDFFYGALPDIIYSLQTGIDRLEPTDPLVRPIRVDIMRLQKLLKTRPTERNIHEQSTNEETKEGAQPEGPSNGGTAGSDLRND